MPTNREVLAGVRILVCVARADGHLTEGERAALEAAVHELPGGQATSVAELLASDIDLELELAQLLSDESREHVYQAALVLSHVDGAASPQEMALIERLHPQVAEPTLLGQVLGETRDTFLPTKLGTVYDPAQRTAEVQEDTLKYAILCGGLGAMPIPGAAVVSDLFVVVLQAKMVRDIGCYWGHNLDAKAARSLIGTMAGSIGVRIAVSNLARLVPGWGSALAAATAFGTTVAIGRAADLYFASGAVLSVEELRKSYAAGVAEGKAAFAEQKAAVEEAHARNESTMAELNAKLARKEITHEQFLAAVEALT